MADEEKKTVADFNNEVLKSATAIMKGQNPQKGFVVSPKPTVLFTRYLNGKPLCDMFQDERTGERRKNLPMRKLPFHNLRTHQKGRRSDD